MAAGLGFKDFVTGEVLTAADVDGYLMQGVWVFASAAARDAAVTSPQEGNFAYLKDTNVTTYYTGSAWANLDTTGMTNPMTTTGDTIYSSSGSTPARLGIGTSGQVLTVSGGGIPSWATAASGGGMTQIATGTLSGASVNVSLTGTYKKLEIYVRGFLPDTNSYNFQLRFNNDSTGGRYFDDLAFATNNSQTFNASEFVIQTAKASTDTNSFNHIIVPDYQNTSTWKMVQFYSIGNNVSTSTNSIYRSSLSAYNQTGAITEVNFICESGANFSGGTYFIYGVN